MQIKETAQHVGNFARLHALRLASEAVEAEAEANGPNPGIGQFATLLYEGPGGMLS